MSKIFGATYVQTGVSRSYSENDGWQTVMTFEGTETAISALQGQYSYDADKVEHTALDGGIHRLTVTYNNAADGSTELPNIVWEFPSNMVQQDVLVTAHALGLDDKVIFNLRQYKDGNTEVSGTALNVKASTPYKMATLDGTGTGANFSSVEGDDGSSNALKILRLLQAGVEFSLVSQTVARVTSTVSGSGALTTSRALAGKLMTTAQLSSLLSPPADIRFTLPSDDSTDYTGFKWRWLAHSPDVSMIGGGKWRIVQEFWWDLWPLVLYTQYS